MTARRLAPFLFHAACALAVAVGTLWVFVAGPVQELILERFFDPPQPAPALTCPPDGPQGVLVSDLHLDTWGLADGRPNARESRLLGLLSTSVRLRYRQAARRLGREFRPRPSAPPDAPTVRTLLMGHTHHPDRYVLPGGLTYINSGDWSGYTDHCAYCVLDPDGTVRGPFQWEDAGKAEFGRPAVSPPV